MGDQQPVRAVSSSIPSSNTAPPKADAKKEADAQQEAAQIRTMLFKLAAAMDQLQGESTLTADKQSNQAIVDFYKDFIQDLPYKMKSALLKSLDVGKEVMDAKSEGKPLSKELKAKVKEVKAQLNSLPEAKGLLEAIETFAKALTNLQLSSIKSGTDVSKAMGAFSEAVTGLVKAIQDKQNQLQIEQDATSNQAGLSSKVLIGIQVFIGVIGAGVSALSGNIPGAIALVVITVATTIPVKDGQTILGLGTTAIATGLQNAGMDEIGAKGVADSVMFVVIVASMAVTGGATAGSAAETVVEEGAQMGGELVESVGSNIADIEPEVEEVGETASQTSRWSSNGAKAGAKFGVLTGLGAANPLSDIIAKIVYASSIGPNATEQEKEDKKNQAKMIGAIVGAAFAVVGGVAVSAGPMALKQLASQFGSETLESVSNKLSNAFDMSDFFKGSSKLWQTPFSQLNTILNSTARISMVGQVLQGIGSITEFGVQTATGVIGINLSKITKSLGDAEGSLTLVDSFQQTTSRLQKGEADSTTKLYKTAYDCMESLVAATRSFSGR